MRMDEGDRVVTVACTLRDDVELPEEPVKEPRPLPEPETLPTEDEIEEMLSLSLKDEEE